MDPCEFSIAPTIVPDAQILQLYPAIDMTRIAAAESSMNCPGSNPVLGLMVSDGAAVQNCSFGNPSSERNKGKVAAEEGQKKGSAVGSSKHNTYVGSWRWIEDGLAVLENTEVGESRKANKRRLISMEKEDFVQIIEKEEFTFSCEKKRMASTSRVLKLNRPFDCSICMETKQPTESFTVKPCSHRFCVGCVGRYVAAKLEENVLLIRCPDPECKDGMLDLEMCRWIVPESVIDRWGVMLCENAIGIKRFYCPFRDCSALMVNEPESNPNGVTVITYVECPHCHRMFCAQCKVPWHDGISCQEFQQLGRDERGRDDLLLRQLAIDKKWQRCPRCRMYVEKINGCRFMRCRCGFCFCYRCASPMTEQLHYCAKCRA